MKLMKWKIKRRKTGGNEVDKKGKGKEETVADLLEAKKQNCHCYKWDFDADEIVQSLRKKIWGFEIQWNVLRSKGWS